MQEWQIQLYKSAKFNLDTNLFLWIFILFLAFIFPFGFFQLGHWFANKRDSKCPYTKAKLIKASNLSYESMQKIADFQMQHTLALENAFDLNFSTICKKTGRIFPNTIDSFGKIQLKKCFLKKYYPDSLSSWGSLTPLQKQQISKKHSDIEKFQIHYSSPNPDPNYIHPLYAAMKPGPLYIDLKTSTLVGWRQIPNSELELLVIQKPKQD